MKSARLLIFAGLISALSGISSLAQPSANQAAPAPASAVASPAIPPDQQATKERIEKLFEVLRLRKQMETVLEMFPAMIQKQFQSEMQEINSKLPPGTQVTPQHQAALEGIMKKYMQRAMDLYPVDEMVEDAVPIYQRHISRIDADAVIAFYSSPAGQHLLDEQPAILAEYMPIVMSRMQERTSHLTDEMLAEMHSLVLQNPPSSDSSSSPSK